MSRRATAAARAPRPAVELECRPELTAELLAFWTGELRALPEHQRAGVLGQLASRYGTAGAEQIRKAVTA